MLRNRLAVARALGKASEKRENRGLAGGVARRTNLILHGDAKRLFALFGAHLRRKMAEPTDVLLKWAQGPEANQALDERAAKQARAALSSSQAQERLWRACLQHAQTQIHKNISFAKTEPNPWAPAVALMTVGLDPTRMGAKGGEGPLLWAVREAQWELAAGAAEWSSKEEINRANAEGKTVLMLAAEKLASGSVAGARGLAGAEFVAKIASAKGFDAKHKDQAALAFFTLQGAGVHWATPQARIKGAEPHLVLEATRQLTKALVAAGLDLNSARLGRNVTMGSPICTPLSYLVKRLHQWDQIAGVFSAPKLKDVAEGLIAQMIELGADPGLQIEKIEQNALMQICRGGRLSEKVASSLEWAILGKELGLKAPGSPSAEGGAPPAAKKVSKRL